MLYEWSHGGSEPIIREFLDSFIPYLLQFLDRLVIEYLGSDQAYIIKLGTAVWAQSQIGVRAHEELVRSNF